MPLLVAGVVAGAVSLIPNTTPGSPEAVGNEGPAQTVAQNTARLTRVDRREIDSVLDRFIPAAVERKNLALGWSLAGPEFRASSSLAQWKAGNSPVPYYPARGSKFHGWSVTDVEPGQVIFSLLVHPRPGAKIASYTFAGQMLRQHGHWLVNRLYTTAIFNPVRGSTHEVGPADFQAPGAGSTSPTKTRLSKSWLIPIVGVMSLVVVVPLCLGLVLLVRSRRRRRQIAASGGTELPPLPSTFKSR